MDRTPTVEAATLALREAWDATKPVLALFERLSHIEYPDSTWSHDAPTLSELASAVWWLSREMVGLTDQAARQLPPAPAPAPALVVKVRGAIHRATMPPARTAPSTPGLSVVRVPRGLEDLLRRHGGERRVPIRAHLHP